MSFEKKTTEEPAANFMQWVGGSYYSIESYIKEIKKMGGSRRTNGVPRNIVKGVSKLFLISDMATEQDRQKYKEEYNRRLREVYNKRNKTEKPSEGETKKYGSIKALGPMPRSKPVIFGYFTINSIVYITAPGINVPEELAKHGVEVYEYASGHFGFNDERGCGSLQVDGVYFISEENMEKVKELASSTILESKNVHIFEKPISADNIKRFRGIKEVSKELGEELEIEVAAYDLGKVKEKVEEFKAGVVIDNTQ